MTTTRVEGTYRIIHKKTMLIACTIFSLCFLAPSSAWVSPRPPIISSRGRLLKPSSTSRFMFDWFNPKPAKKTEGETKSDIFSNFFNQVGPKEAASENKVAKEEEVTIAAEIPSPPKEEEEEEIEITSEASVESESILPEADIEHQVHKGTVRWFDRRKGYGFIIPESGENDIFVHQSEIVCSGYRLLIDGEDVEYSVMADSEGRPRAMHVTGPGGGDVRVVEIRGQREKKEE